MALREFRDNAQYRNSVQDVTNILGRVDLVNPEHNIIPKEASTYELLKIQAEAQSQTLSEALSFIKGIVPLAETTDQDQLMADQAGGKVNVQVQQAYLTEIAEKNNLLTRMLQQRHQEKNSKTCGSYFDPLRDPICMIPADIATGQQAQVSDSALKLLPSFLGDTDKEHENLRTFLRAVYDVAITNRLTEACTKAVLRRKLAGTARKLIDSYELEMEQPDRPTLKEIVLKLEDRFMADLQPELANARLSMLKKTPNQTYQMLEGEISELSVLAARGEKENKAIWIKQRKIEVFKAAISEEDRQLLSRENQSRNITGIAEMNLSQAVDFLIKNYSEQHAFMEANQIKKYPSNDIDSLQTVNESEPKFKKKKKKEMALAKKAIEDQKIKDELFQIYETNRSAQQANTFRGRGRGRGNGRFGNKGRGGQFNNGNPRNGNGYKPNWNNGNSGNWNNGNGGNRNNGNGGNWQNGNGNGGNGNNGQKNNGLPRKFVTPAMVNVNPNSCLKCNSPTHRFQEQDKCVYGTGSLMTKPCPSCNEGGHHSSICIKNPKSTIGAPAPREAIDPKFSKWPETSKMATEGQNQLYHPFAQPKNDWLPSLFPN